MVSLFGLHQPYLCVLLSMSMYIHIASRGQEIEETLENFLAVFCKCRFLHMVEMI